MSVTAINAPAGADTLIKIGYYYCRNGHRHYYRGYYYRPSCPSWKAMSGMCRSAG
jgi:hypothetical protein